MIGQVLFNIDGPRTWVRTRYGLELPPTTVQFSIYETATELVAAADEDHRLAGAPLLDDIRDPEVEFTALVLDRGTHPDADIRVLFALDGAGDFIDQLGILTHEATHVALAVMRKLSAPLELRLGTVKSAYKDQTLSREEATCYLVQGIFFQMIDYLLQFPDRCAA